MDLLSTRKRVKAVECRYKHVNLFGPNICTYCGRDAFTIDHVPAIYNSYCYGLQRFQHIKIPSCRTCNSALGDMPKHTLKERAVYLQKWYEKKYNNVLSVDFWTQDELCELKGVLRMDVESFERTRKVAEFVLTNIDRLFMYCERGKSR